MSCGGNGTRRRHRECSHPSPSAGGKPCVGASVEEEQCETPPCPALWSVQKILNSKSADKCQFGYKS